MAMCHKDFMGLTLYPRGARAYFTFVVGLRLFFTRNHCVLVVCISKIRKLNAFTQTQLSTLFKHELDPDWMQLEICTSIAGAFKPISLILLLVNLQIVHIKIY